MRQKPVIPCNCKQCYFCLKEITNGIDHRQKKQKVEVVLKCGTQVKSKKRTKVRMNLGWKSGTYYKMFSRKQLPT
jgi:hypothetical protein